QGGWPDLSGSDRGGKRYLPRRKLYRKQNGGLITMQTIRGDTMNRNRPTAHRTWRLLLLLLAAFGLVAGVPIVAQSGRGTLTGTIKDTNGAVIQGATITLTETQTGSPYDSKSGPEGLFTFPELPPGTYTLEVNAPGFET